MRIYVRTAPVSGGCARERAARREENSCKEEAQF